jgi:hypothetical protein
LEALERVVPFDWFHMFYQKNQDNIAGWIIWKNNRMNIKISFARVGKPVYQSIMTIQTRLGSARIRVRSGRSPIIVNDEAIALFSLDGGVPNFLQVKHELMRAFCCPRLCKMRACTD